MKVWQQPLPEIYQQLSEPELRVRIASAKETLGKRLVILGHHYQQDAVLIAFAKVVQGHAALKEHFRAYLKMLGTVEVLSLDQFVETEDTIFFEATVRTVMGQVQVYDAFVLSDGKATHHFTGVK